MEAIYVYIPYHIGQYLKCGGHSKVINWEKINISLILLL